MSLAEFFKIPNSANFKEDRRPKSGYSHIPLEDLRQFFWEILDHITALREFGDWFLRF